MPEDYEEILREEGIWLGDMLEVSYSALPRESALKAIDVLRKRGYQIKGGDVIEIMNGKATLVGHGAWACEEADYTTYDEYREESWKIAERRVREYNRDRDVPTYFAFVVGRRRH